MSGDTKVLFAQGSELAAGLPMFYPVPPEVLFDEESKPGLNVDYYDNYGMQGVPLYTDKHDTLDANWSDKAPRDDMDGDDFAVRWSGTIVPQQSAEYQLGVISTANTKVYINDKLVADTSYHFRDEFGDPRLRHSQATSFSAGESYQLRVEARESYADAQVQLVWAQLDSDLAVQALKIANQADAVVMFMGLTARMEGEEMDMHIDGFRGGDRTSLELPGVQQELIKKVQALGKPMVLVLLNGSALAINWEKDNVPAIVEAWYPGQAAGTAIAKLLFGDINPAGRLPVTFYKSLADLPPFTDYNMTSQTYRYFAKEPLFPFGYGLSYSTFVYSDFEVDTLDPQGLVKLSAQLTNTSELDGDEVVQVYIAKQNRTQVQPLRSLKAFRRVHLKAGETQIIKFDLDAAAFSLVIDDIMQKVPGKFSVSIGGGQPQQNMPTSSNVLTKTVLIK